MIATPPCLDFEVAGCTVQVAIIGGTLELRDAAAEVAEIAAVLFEEAPTTAAARARVPAVVDMDGGISRFRQTAEDLRGEPDAPIELAAVPSPGS